MAAELVGGALLSALLEVLVDKLSSSELINFFRGNRIVAKLLEKLNITLWSANELLNDAEDKQIMNGNIKHWVDKLNEVFNEAEHVMDKINTKAMRREIKGQWSARRIMKKVFSNDSAIPFDQEIKQDIEGLIDMLKFLLEQKDYLGLKEGVRSKRLKRSPAPLITDPSSVIGRNGNKEAMVELLFSENVSKEISVIPIVGMGGVGKTTLARLVYDDVRVKDHFEKRAWVTVSDDFDVFRLAKLVFENLTSKQSKETELGKLQEELEKFLDGKKFFLVLDDVWNENYGRWNTLKSFLQVGGNGSKIIMTTRNGEIGSMMGNVASHPLATMSDEDCWQLFKKHAFHNVEPSEGLEKIGIEIVKKCKGLPLAVMSLAGLLCSVSDSNEWTDILKSDVWDLQKKGNDEILPSLWLSYNYLPPHLKRCFAYCSIFPKDYEYDKKKIVLLWMAEGLLPRENMEDVGEEYLKTLISRSLIQMSTKDDSSFVMHDLVHDMATFVSGKGFCIRSVERSEVLGLTDKTRHFVFGDVFSRKKNSEELSKAKHLRTILRISPSDFPNLLYFDISMVKKLECLRVLSLFNSYVKQVPDSIGKLKQLRYLDLSGSYIKRLPDAICTLYNLQTLLLRYCSRLKRLPANMGSLVNLRHLDISNTPNLRKISMHKWNLKGLRTLGKVVLNDKHSDSRIKKLKEFSQYGSDGHFEIEGLENVANAKDVSDAEFEKKFHITNLTLEWSAMDRSAENDRAVLDAMKPHTNLKKLHIEGYGGQELSNWVGDNSFDKITEVTLYSCKHCIQLPPLGQLPALRKLNIQGLDGVTAVNSEFYGSSYTVPFISLETLEIRSMDELQSWSFEARGAFPCLKMLTLENCRMLKSISPHCLPSLKSLQMSECPQMEALLLPIDQGMNTAFPSLESIDISDCPKLELSGLPLPPSLKELTIRKCDMVYAQRMQWGLIALTKLEISKCNIPDSFPEEGLLPTTLAALQIWGFSNLKSLNGKAFQHLTSLKWLTILNCPILRSLPEERMPASLELFEVAWCPILEARLKRETGEDWHKISHIPKIIVDSQVFRAR